MKVKPSKVEKCGRFFWQSKNKNLKKMFVYCQMQYNLF
jgi:hypothetical protein